MLQINDKVIVKSNEDEPYWIGTYLGMEEKLHGDIPLVRDELDKTLMCFGQVIPYTQKMVDRLDKLSWERQWILLHAIKEWESGKKFILIRGLPGSGKSTKAKELAGHDGQVFSTDDFFMLTGKYIFDRDKIGYAHKWNQRRSLAAIKAGIPIVVIDNTNTTIKEMRSYIPHIKQCMLMGYQVIIAEPDTVWAMDIEKLLEMGTHNVPAKTVEAMKRRYVQNVQVEDVMFKVKT